MRHPIDEEFLPGLETIVGWAPYLKIDKFQGLSAQLLDEARAGYLRKHIPYLVRTLCWAVNHPNADFVSLLFSARFDNEQIYKYLVVLREQFVDLEKEVFGEA